MPKRLEKIFEREYMKKGKTKKESDLIFYKFMNKRKNKSGSALVTIVVAVAFFMFGILIVGLLMPDVAITRSSDNLDCSNMSISDGNKLACIGADIAIPGFIITILLISGGAVVYKLIGM